MVITKGIVLTSLDQLVDKFKLASAPPDIPSFKVGSFVIVGKGQAKPTLGKAGIVLTNANENGILSVGIITEKGRGRVSFYKDVNLVPLNKETLAKWRHKNLHLLPQVIEKVNFE